MRKSDAAEAVPSPRRGSGAKVRAGEPSRSPGIRKRPGGNIDSARSSVRQARRYSVNRRASSAARASSSRASGSVASRSASQAEAASARSGERASATVGYSLQDNRARGVLWGALPINYADGSLVDYPVSASTSADWTYWNVRDQTTFAEVVYRLGGGWELRMDNEFRWQADNLLRTTTKDPVISALGLSYRPPEMKSLLVSAQIDNLWNSDFEEVPGVPAAKRQLTGSMTYSW